MTDTTKKPQKVRVDVTGLDEAIARAYEDGLHAAMDICKARSTGDCTREDFEALRCAVAIQNELDKHNELLGKK